MKDLHDLARTASALPQALQDAQIRGVQQAALLVTRSIRAEIRAATGGDNRLSGVGARGARVGAKYDVRGRVNPTAIIRATGPLHLVDRDTAPHRIAPRSRRGRGKRKALRFADGTFAASAEHPGTRGKHVWTKGIATSRPLTKSIFDKEIHAAIVKAVKG